MAAVMLNCKSGPGLSMNKFGAGLMCRVGSIVAPRLLAPHQQCLDITRWRRGMLRIKICLHSGVEKSELEARSGEPVEDVGETKFISSSKLCWWKILAATSVNLEIVAANSVGGKS